MSRFLARMRTPIIIALALVPLLWQPATARAAGRVQLELIGDVRGDPTALQQWGRALSQAGIRNVRIRSGGAAKVGIEVGGTENSPVYTVTGVIRSRTELILPGGRFSQHDTARLARWLDDLAQQGPEDRRPEKAAFGLTADQFERVLQDMGRSLGFSTLGVGRDVAVRKIGESLTLPLRMDADLYETLAGETVAEELSDLSRGTALAYVLRPVGMCVVPHESGGRIAYVIVRAREGLSIWPVGWEPDGLPHDTLPALFEFHNVNVQGVSATRALTAIAGILKVPALIDHNALARHGVEPDKVPVSHPQRRTTYSLALRRILGQAQLKYEVRLDEAGQPFLWVTTIKPM